MPGELIIRANVGGKVCTLVPGYWRGSTVPLTDETAERSVLHIIRLDATLTTLGVITITDIITTATTATPMGIGDDSEKTSVFRHLHRL